MNTQKFISITRRFTYGNKVSEDTSSISLNGRKNTPGFVQVVGGLEHCAEFAPKTEADRLALIAWLQSDECRALTGAPVKTGPAHDLAETLSEAEETRRGELLVKLAGLQESKNDGTPYDPPRYELESGNKTALGVFRTFLRFVVDGE